MNYLFEAETNVQIASKCFHPDLQRILLTKLQIRRILILLLNTAR